VLFYGFATYGNAGWMREQVCKYMCPYARFQSAMFDRNTLIIAYDPMRGEPRGPRRRGLGSVLQRGRGLLDKLTAYDYVFRASQHPTAADNRMQATGTIALGEIGEAAQPLPKFAFEALGDCIDCTICVQVCPTGIDIRNGLQYECIGCAACIDGCDQVMDKVGRPRGLIRYSKGRVLRPRVLVYSAVLGAVAIAAGVSLYLRTPLKVDVIRDRAALAREVEGGLIENVYRLQIMNTAEEARAYEIRASGLPGILVWGESITGVPAATSRMVPVRVRIDAGPAAGSYPIEFSVTALGVDGVEVREPAVFIVR
jgi:polyferredoxin